MKSHWIPTIALLLFLTGSCSPMDAKSPQPEGPAQAQPEGDGQTPSAPPTSDPIASRLIDAARSDLSQKLGIAADQITVTNARAVTWPDSSLGCPQPGMAYAQMLTPGYLILLEAAGNVYEYHADRKAYAFYCENPEPPVPGTPGDI